MRIIFGKTVFELKFSVSKIDESEFIPLNLRVEIYLNKCVKKHKEFKESFDKGLKIPFIKSLRYYTELKFRKTLSLRDAKEYADKYWLTHYKEPVKPSSYYDGEMCNH